MRRVDREQRGRLAPVTFKPAIVRMRLANGQRRFLRDPVIIERVAAGRAFHFFQA